MTDIRLSTLNAVRVKLRTPEPFRLHDLEEIVTALRIATDFIRVEDVTDTADGPITNTAASNPQIVAVRLGSLEVIFGGMGAGAAAVAILKGVVELLDRIRDRALRAQHIPDAAWERLVDRDLFVLFGAEGGADEWIEEIGKATNERLDDVEAVVELRLDDNRELPKWKPEGPDGEAQVLRHTIRVLHERIEEVEIIEYP